MDCWSPTMVALDAHLHMVSEVAKHLDGLGSKGWWTTKEVQGTQIRQLADRWEKTVPDLKWNGAIPARVCVGLTPLDWRSYAEDEPAFSRT